MVHEVAVEDFHEVVTAVEVAACDNQATRAIPAIKTVANIGHTMQSQEPLLISSILNKVTGTITHLPSSFREAESRTFSYVARPHYRRQPHMLKRRLQQRSSVNNNN